ncbi:hypothetical protein EYZ11_004078 [Aspergillus tanneri]|uniref:Uncharacterized protein n=1 Tax=Aspergillus tanneri TaxID=1220188 RepID=A0A4S3JLE5_9EURO|nr:hypothetical protein EYZ11_004078 [Aspergillus tanneri]
MTTVISPMNPSKGTTLSHPDRFDEKQRQPAIDPE